MEYKDVFTLFYKNQLAARLIENKSSIDLERELLGKLQAIYGLDYTHKLQEMINDVDYSHDSLSAGFDEYVVCCSC